jgi:hypothetical protein
LLSALNWFLLIRGLRKYYFFAIEKTMFIH